MLFSVERSRDHDFCSGLTIKLVAYDVKTYTIIDDVNEYVVNFH